MAYAKHYKSFRLNDYVEIVCFSQRTSYGFRHVASLRENGSEICTARCSYYNRTWEAYTFQSVMQRVIEKSYPKKSVGRERYLKLLEKDPSGESDRFLNMVGAVARMGDVLGNDQKEANQFKKRILGTVPGVDMPEDFDSLPEEEKARRLDGAIDIISKKEAIQ